MEATNSEDYTDLAICIHETRTRDEVSVKLLVLSIARHEPNARLHLFVDRLSPEVQSWLLEQPNVILEYLESDPALGWNAKPKHIQYLLDKGLSSIVWFDSDLIVTRPFLHLVMHPSENTLVLAEEFFTIRNRGVAVRTAGWGLSPGRDLPFTPNSCVLRVTRAHRSLLLAWQKLLDRDDYVKCQRDDWTQRPFYMMGDQDALSALLGSQDFKDIEVRHLRRGRDVAQCFQADGYSPKDRIASLWRGMPPFVHAQGEKPWDISAMEKTYQLLSPYRSIAAQYAHRLTLSESHWLSRETWHTRVLQRITHGHPALAGLLPAMIARTSKRIKAIIRLTGLTK